MFGNQDEDAFLRVSPDGRELDYECASAGQALQVKLTTQGGLASVTLQYQSCYKRPDADLESIA